MTLRAKRNSRGMPATRHACVILLQYPCSVFARPWISRRAWHAPNVGSRCATVRPAFPRPPFTPHPHAVRTHSAAFPASAAGGRSAIFPSLIAAPSLLSSPAMAAQRTSCRMAVLVLAACFMMLSGAARTGTSFDGSLRRACGSGSYGNVLSQHAGGCDAARHPKQVKTAPTPWEFISTTPGLEILARLLQVRAGHAQSVDQFDCLPSHLIYLPNPLLSPHRLPT